ncbi:hypothetical protein DICSQDRAFT_129323 [Dichomitus squalens LYAD-421 SS1]|uniref:Uncharacterized protein n=1 Tax=Dichomitus squalens (strain LYAD-421) TaxID=732165 RepID=R7SNE6_DICSQ|nr:uncharacterized protein DICSQDRAFT_129323 [Dichomitus squalens LYAD-421 SS1]EJF57694.1 hypothetical protein DICSQDRAFT_129323 [Dichomitus squalens LYAD-421 SS1]
MPWQTHAVSAQLGDRCPASIRSACLSEAFSLLASNPHFFRNDDRSDWFDRLKTKWTKLGADEPHQRLCELWSAPLATLPDVLTIPVRNVGTPGLSSRTNGRILVRDAYAKLIWRICKYRLDAPASGVIITGQPGCGKSIFIWVMLRVLLMHDHPVVLILEEIAYLFYKRERSADAKRKRGSGSVREPPRPLWVLLDHDQRDTPIAGMNSACVFPVYSTSPNPKRYAQIDKHRCPALFGMPLWTQPELLDGVELFYLYDKLRTDIRTVIDAIAVQTRAADTAIVPATAPTSPTGASHRVRSPLALHPSPPDVYPYNDGDTVGLWPSLPSTTTPPFHIPGSIRATPPLPSPTPTTRATKRIRGRTFVVTSASPPPSPPRKRTLGKTSSLAEVSSRMSSPNSRSARASSIEDVIISCIDDNVLSHALQVLWRRDPDGWRTRPDRGILETLVADAIEKFGYIARDVCDGIFHPDNILRRHRDVVKGITSIQYQDLVGAFLSDTHCNPTSLSHRIIALIPIHEWDDPHTKTISTSDSFNMEFKSEGVTERVKVALRHLEDRQARHLFSLCHFTPESSSFRSYLFETIIHRRLSITSRSEMLSNLSPMEESGVSHEAPHFSTSKSTTTVVHSSTLRRAAGHHAHAAGSASFTAQTLVKSISLKPKVPLPNLDFEAYYVPSAPNNSFFDAFFFERDLASSIVTLCILQITTAVEHEGSDKGYLLISRLINGTLATLTLDPSKPLECQVQVTWTWKMPNGWDATMHPHGHVYHLPIQFGVPASSREASPSH